MNNKNLIIKIVILVAIIIGGIYFYPNLQVPEFESQEECIKQTLEDARKYIPASEEPVGAKRTDNEGNVWIKRDDEGWETPSFKSTTWGEALIDEQKGGAKYVPKDLYEGCRKYIKKVDPVYDTEMKQGITEIINQVIQEQTQKGIDISIENLEVRKYGERRDGTIRLNCEEIDYESDEAMIGSIADKLFEKYPNYFAEGNSKDYSVSIVSCSKMESSSDGVSVYSSKTVWRIQDGFYDYSI